MATGAVTRDGSRVRVAAGTGTGQRLEPAGSPVAHPTVPATARSHGTRGISHPCLADGYGSSAGTGTGGSSAPHGLPVAITSADDGWTQMGLQGVRKRTGTWSWE
ncbi:hypothetical protein FB45DRAFT_862720 [Roridomyces roridus]|uniref:Uncharacterized protein n=1 Tax=Roridomyces roridus TaxID=1738132 RepID=A0AAD7FVL3_9AGAR|nr:hypothetical protein FB45DRAFT_862720 [Roridomyces roridus]